MLWSFTDRNMLHLSLGELNLQICRRTLLIYEYCTTDRPPPLAQRKDTSVPFRDTQFKTRRRRRRGCSQCVFPEIGCLQWNRGSTGQWNALSDQNKELKSVHRMKTELHYAFLSILCQNPLTLSTHKLLFFLPKRHSVR